MFILLYLKLKWFEAYAITSISLSSCLILQLLHTTNNNTRHPDTFNRRECLSVHLEQTHKV